MSMQQILNSKERKNAFFKFLAFFFVTVILVVTAVYFNFRLPLQQNEKLQKERVAQNMRDDKQEHFVAIMDNALQLLDSLDKDKVNQEQVAMQIEVKIKEMNDIRPGDRSAYDRMNKAIVERFSELKDNKKKLKSSESDKNRIEELQTELTRVKGELSTKEGQLDILRGQN